MAKPRLRTEKFGKWLQEKRGKQGDSLFASRLRTAVGDVLKINRSAVRKIEAGQPPSVLQAHAIAHVVRLPVSVIVDAVVGELIGKPISLPTPEPPFSDEAIQLARWFDAQTPEKKRGILITLDLQDAQRVEEKKGRGTVAAEKVQPIRKGGVLIVMAEHLPTCWCDRRRRRCSPMVCQRTGVSE